MISFNEALKKIMQHTAVLKTTKIPIEKSVGMILAENLYSNIAMPPFNKSAVDGYALKAGDIKTIPAILKNLNSIKAGQSFTGKLQTGECVKIMTGAPLPKGSDSVVMVEFTKTHGDKITVSQVLKKGANVCLKAEDLKRGQKILTKGAEIKTSHVAIMAAAGKKYIKIIAAPRATILSTGGEIIPAGRKLPKNSIYNSNGPMLEAMFNSDGIRARFIGIAKDDKRDLSKFIKKGITSDIFLISGAVSVGDYDFVPEVLRKLKVKQIFHQVKIKPGKPLFFGIKNKTIIFGIPGNPLAGFLAYQIFIRPALLKMKGCKNCYPVFRKGILKKPFHRQNKRKHFALIKITKKQNQYYLSPINSHGSGDVASLSKADGFMIIKENSRALNKNTKAKFITWKKI